MRCKEVIERLSEYWSNELDERMKGEITAHLRVCPSCQHEWAILQAAMDALHSAPTPEPPFELLSRIQSAVAAKQHRRPVFAWRWQWAMAFGTAAIAIAIVSTPFLSQLRERRTGRYPVVAEAPAPLISQMPPRQTLPESTHAAPSAPYLKPSLPSPMERIAKPHKSTTEAERYRAERRKEEVAGKFIPPSPSTELPVLSVPSGERLPEQQKDIDIPADIAPTPGKENEPQLAELPSQPRRVPFRAELEFSERARVPRAGLAETAKSLSSPQEIQGSPPEPQGPAAAVPQIGASKSAETTLMGQHFPTIMQQYGGGLRQTLPAILFNLRWARFEPVVVGKVRLWELMLGSDTPQVVTVSVQPGEKVEILNAQQPIVGESKGLIVWRDKLPSGRETSIPILLRANEVGTRRLLVTVETLDGKTSSWWCIFPATVREEQPRIRHIVTLQVEQWTVINLLAHLAWEGKVAFLVPEQISHRTVHVPMRPMPLSEIFTLLRQQIGGQFIRFGNTFSWVSPVPALAVPIIKQ
ncbi:MAG: zf-HC2 domain-containing protein [Armatimonadota bacterium]